MAANEHSDTDHADRGRAVRHRLFGEASDEGFAKNASAAIAPDLNRMTDEILFGQVWTRPGLELPLRSLVTIAALMAMGKDAQVRFHIRGGLRAGLTREQITEAIIHLAYYAGWPAAVNAMEAARQAFADVDAESG